MLAEVSEFEATAAARLLSATPGTRRYGLTPGDLLEVVYAERLKAPARSQPHMPPTRTNAQMQHVESVVHDHPRWEFTDGRESPTHYAARIAVLATLMPIGEATVTGGVFSCGTPGCVDCTRVPLRGAGDSARGEVA